MSYYVYILECSDKSYYTGFTDDVDRRVMEHNLGIYPNAYTYRRRPVKKVFFYEFQTKQDAMDFEIQVKGWSRAKKEALINGKWSHLPWLSKKKFQRHGDSG